MAYTTRVSDDPLEESWFGGEDVLQLQGNAARSVAAAAAQAVGLKVFPAVAQKLMQQLSDPDVSIGALREVIEQDAAIAGRLLRVANSAMYRRGHFCNSIDEAVLRLGTQQVKAIVAGISAFGMFPADTEVAKSMRAHGAGVAALAGVLGREWRGGFVGDFFLTGLLHDLGKLIALQVGEFAYADVPEEILNNCDGVHQLEQEQLGYDHAALGAAVLHGWRFSPDVVRTIAWHHSPGPAYVRGGPIGIGVALLRMADQLEKKIVASPEMDEAFMHEFAKGGACSYAEFSAEVLIAMWP